MSSATMAPLIPSSPSLTHLMYHRITSSPTSKHPHCSTTKYTLTTPVVAPKINPCVSEAEPTRSEKSLNPSGGPSLEASAIEGANAVMKNSVSLVQPKKDWVLPARAKPGRKPSVTEPLTKRKAQNRASQRAFRERKQSYLQELESKVAAYETAEIDRSVEIQKLAQRLSTENDSLRQQLASWKEKATRLEEIIEQTRLISKTSTVASSARPGPGCRAPSHEKPTSATRSVLSNSGARTKEKGSVRFVDALHSSESAAALPINRKPTLDTERKATIDSISTAAVQNNNNVSPPLRSLWGASSNKTACRDTPVADSIDGKKTKILTGLPLLSSDSLPIEGGCGFCTESSPCVCAENFIDLSGGADASSDPQPWSELSLPIRKRCKEDGESDDRMNVASLTTKLTEPCDIGRPKKLWYTVEAEQIRESPSLGTQFKSAPQSARRLWVTTKALDPQKLSPEPVCNGDPSTCSACSTDPGLAAFCEAVTTATATPQSHSDTHRDRELLAREPSQPETSVSASHLTTTSSTSARDPRLETIPSAWRQIRSHPRFPQWQGGLDLLAEVVSKRSGSVHSPLLGNARLGSTEREASVEIEPARASTMRPLTSNDRATSNQATQVSDPHSMSENDVSAVAQPKRDYTDWERDDGARPFKQRRVLIDTEAVQEALAMLDAGTVDRQRSSRASAASDRDASAASPCPCPWRPRGNKIG